MTEPQRAFNRPSCEVHGKVLFHSKSDALGSLTGHLKKQRIRVYPCSKHPGKVHMTKESVRYRLTDGR